MPYMPPNKLSLPAWECGLKYQIYIDVFFCLSVTPCVGVWIEILKSMPSVRIEQVTPCVGVWIEILETLSVV